MPVSNYYFPKSFGKPFNKQNFEQNKYGPVFSNGRLQAYLEIVKNLSQTSILKMK